MAAFGVAVITKEVFVEIQLLKKHGFRLRQIAKEVGCGSQHRTASVGRERHA